MYSVGSALTAARRILTAPTCSVRAMEPTHRAGTNRSPSQAVRQMTLGECMALARELAAGEKHHPQRPLDPDVLADELLALRVCRICGWTRRGHEGACRPLTCGSYTAP